MIIVNVQVVKMDIIYIDINVLNAIQFVKHALTLRVNVLVAKVDII